MVIFHHDSVVEAHPMISPAACSDSGFLERAKTRGCLSRIQNRHSSATYGRDELSGKRRDSRKVLKKVQSHTLASQNTSGRAGKTYHCFPRLSDSSILFDDHKFQSWIN